MHLFHRPQRCIAIQFSPDTNNAVAPPARKEWVLTTCTGIRCAAAAHFIHFVSRALKEGGNNFVFGAHTPNEVKYLIVAFTGHRSVVLALSAGVAPKCS